MGEQSLAEDVRQAILKALDGARIGVGTGVRRDSMDPEQVATIVLHELRPALLHHKETAKELAQVRAGTDAMAQTLVAAHQESARLAGEMATLKSELHYKNHLLAGFGVTEYNFNVAEISTSKSLDSLCEDHDKVLAERDRLTKEVERLNKALDLVPELANAAEECGQYSEDDPYLAKPRERWNALEAEIAKLRGGGNRE